MHVSHPEISCVLWKRLYHSNKSILCHGLGFDIKSGLPCYLEFYTNNHSSRLFSHHDSLIPHHLPFLCMYMCTHVYLWVYVYSMEYFLRVFFLSFFFILKSRDQVSFNDWVGRRKGNLKYWSLKHRRSKTYLFFFFAKSIIECLCSYCGPFIV